MEEKHYCTETTHQTGRHSGVVRCSSLTPCLLVCLVSYYFWERAALLLACTYRTAAITARVCVTVIAKTDLPPILNSNRARKARN